MNQETGDIRNLYPFSTSMTPSALSSGPLYDSCPHRFTVHHTNLPCSSGYQTRASSFLTHGKRKSSSESTFHPVTKQQITEARIAASMQRLSLVNNPHVAQNGNRTCDEGFFEDDMDSNHDIGTELDLTDGSNKPQEFPQYQLATEVKEGLAKMLDDVLPKKILDTMIQSCLALVPYNPPDVILKVHGVKEITEDEEEKSSEKIRIGGISPKVATENDEQMNGEWDLDPDENMMQ